MIFFSSWLQQVLRLWDSAFTRRKANADSTCWILLDIWQQQESLQKHGRTNSLIATCLYNAYIYWKVWGVRPKWGEKTTFKNMRKHGKLGKIMEDNEKIWQHDKGHKNMTIWEFDSLRELWLKFLSQCAWMVSSTSLQCQGLRFVQSLWADPLHVILKGESGQQWSPVSWRSKHLQMNGLQMAGSHRGQGRAGSRPSNIFK